MARCPSQSWINRRVLARVGHGVTAGVAKHVSVDLEREAGSLADTLHEAIDGVCGERPAALRLEHEGTIRIPLQFALGCAIRRQLLSIGWGKAKIWNVAHSDDLRGQPQSSLT